MNDQRAGMPRFENDDRVCDPESGMVGKVLEWWTDDGGQWVMVRWDDSTIRAEELQPHAE